MEAFVKLGQDEMTLSQLLLRDVRFDRLHKPSVTPRNNNEAFYGKR